jgi:hypothetical protein
LFFRDCPAATHLILGETLNKAVGMPFFYVAVWKGFFLFFLSFQKTRVNEADGWRKVPGQIRGVGV